MSLITIPARRGKATFAKRGDKVRVVNTHGTQVVDTWAFVKDDLAEFMSMEHTRAHIQKLIPIVGDVLLTNHRRPILTLLEDTAGGVHDTLMAACDRYRYELLGCKDPHDNCTDNLAEGLAGLGLSSPETPSPLNLFMNIPWTPGGALSFQAPVGTPGCYVTLRAEIDCIMAFSACPQDILPINGLNRKPVEAHFEVLY